MSNELPSAIADDLVGRPEFRMGVRRLQVQLDDGRVFENVMVAGGRVVKVLGCDGIPFEASDVVAVTDFTDSPLPPGW